ncbi:MAG: hypothetical protein V7K25_16645 [Nostoc sp.]
MSSVAQGIPGLPDLTHPIELVQFGTQALKASLLLVFLVVALGVAIALISFSLRRSQPEQFIKKMGLKPRASRTALIY